MQMIGRLIYERFTRFENEDYINQYVHTLPSEVITPLHWSEEDVKYLEDIYDNKFNINMPIPYEESWTLYHEALSKHHGID